MIIKEVRAVADRIGKHIPDVDFCGTWRTPTDFIELVEVAKNYDFAVRLQRTVPKIVGGTNYIQLLDPHDSVVFGMDGRRHSTHILKNIKSYDVVYAMGKGGELGFNKNKWQFIVFNSTSNPTN